MSHCPSIYHNLVQELPIARILLYAADRGCRQIFEKIKKDKEEKTINIVLMSAIVSGKYAA